MWGCEVAWEVVMKKRRVVLLIIGLLLAVSIIALFCFNFIYCKSLGLGIEESQFGSIDITSQVNGSYKTSEFVVAKKVIRNLNSLKIVETDEYIMMGGETPNISVGILDKSGEVIYSYSVYPGEFCSYLFNAKTGEKYKIHWHFNTDSVLSKIIKGSNISKR